jgi:hypothetical protein
MYWRYTQCDYGTHGPGELAGKGGSSGLHCGSMGTVKKGTFRSNHFNVNVRIPHFAVACGRLPEAYSVVTIKRLGGVFWNVKIQSRFG